MGAEMFRVVGRSDRQTANKSYKANNSFSQFYERD
jgi:hypothetical protein